jgi:hypothetical protein
MKKLLLLLVIFAIAIISSGAPPPAAEKDHARTFKKETYVFICNSNGAYAYHSTKSCRGLNRCTHEILKVTLSEAVNTYRRKPCKICE